MAPGQLSLRAVRRPAEPTRWAGIAMLVASRRFTR